MAEKIEGFKIGLDLDHLSVDRGLKGLKDNLKTVNSEMKNNMSAFDRSERSVKKYETSLKGANKKLEVQKRAVAEAEKEYKKMVDEYGRGSKEAEKAAQEYNNQAASLNSLEGYIGRTTKELEKLKKEQRIANSAFTKMGNVLDTAGKGIQKTGKVMSKAGSMWTKGITMPIIGLGTAAVAAAKKTADHADKVLISAQKVGLGTDEYQEMSYALKQMGLGQSDVDRALGRLNQRMGRATDGNKKYQKALKNLGISQKDLEKGTYDTDDAFIKIIESLQDMESSSERSAKASEIFGTNMARTLMPAINGGAEELENLRKKAGDAGAVMSGQALKDSQEFKNAMDDLKEKGAGLTHELGAKLAPVLTDKLIPVIEEKGIPMLEKMVDGVVDAVEWYSNLDDATKKNVHRLGLLVIAGGPVLSILGKMTTGFGTVVRGVGKFSTRLGKASGGKGLLASMARLGPLAVGGVAVAGIVGIGTAIYNTRKKSEKLEEVNLDLTKSLSDQAKGLEDNAAIFDELSGKAEASNSELAELYDLNIRISETANPGEIKELQKQYDELAKKSGLSKDELKRLFKANDHIIDQSPDVEKSISNQGNEFVKNTEAVNEYIQSLYEMSRQELADELKIAEENTVELLKEQNELKERGNDLDDQSREIRELEALSEEERNDKIRDRLEEIRIQMVKNQNNGAKMVELEREQSALIALKNESAGEALKIIQEQREELNDKVDKNQEELDKIESLNEEAANILLKQVGINEEGEKGLSTLDKTIEKNEQEIEKLEEKKKKNGELKDEEKERLEELIEINERQRDQREILHEEVGVYKDINSLVQTKLDKVSDGKEKRIEEIADLDFIKKEEGNIVQQIEDKNSEYDKSIEKLEKQKEQEGANKKEINGQIKELEGKKLENEKVIKKILEELDLWDDVKDVVDLGKDKIGQKNSEMSKGTRELMAQIGEQKKNNKFVSTGIIKERERTKEAGKSVSKKVTVTDLGTIRTLNLKAIESKNKKVTVTEGNSLAQLNARISQPIRKTVELVGRGLGKIGYAKGTPPGGHPGGPAVVGDGGGSELVSLPSGQAFLSPDTDTLLNLPKGTHVAPHRETNRILKSIRYYANGTDGYARSDFARLLATNGRSESSVVVRDDGGNRKTNGYMKKLLEATLQQNKILMQLLTKNTNVYLDTGELISLADSGLANNADLESFYRGDR